MSKRQILLLVLMVLVSALGVYGAVGQEITGTHAIQGKGEVTCLQCHYGKYEEMVSTAHGQYLVEEMSAQDATSAQPETYVCIACHGKRDRWGEFGMADWAVWYENSPSNNYAGEWWALGYKQIVFPYGKGWTGTWKNTTSTPTSYINLTVTTGVSGRTIHAKFKFFDYTYSNADTGPITLNETSSGVYNVVLSGLYPDYFSIQLNASSSISATRIEVKTDDVVYMVANSSKTFTIETYDKYLGPLKYSNGAWSHAKFAGSHNWNFHTGKYTKIIKMSALWENVRTITTIKFPYKGIPIEYIGTISDRNSCSSDDSLCHSTLTMIKDAAEGKLPETRAIGAGYQPYYQHSMTLSTNSKQICGTCHAQFFAEGLTAHYGVQCYDCHAGHPMPAGAE